MRMRCSVPSSLLRLADSFWSFKIPLQFILIVSLWPLWTPQSGATLSNMILYVHTSFMEKQVSVFLNNTFIYFPFSHKMSGSEMGAERCYRHLYSSRPAWCWVSHGHSVHVFAKKGRKMVFSNWCYFSG